MTQIKVYARDSWLSDARTAVSAALRTAVTEALDYPTDKWVHRYFPMSAEDFVWGLDRSERYTVIEVSLFSGRTTEAKKALLRGLFVQLQAHVGLDPNDVEITLTETPRENWGIRGLPGDELELGYRVDV